MKGVALFLNDGADDGETVINVKDEASSYLYEYDLSLEVVGA